MDGYSETGYWITIGDSTPLKGKRKHSDRDCRYIEDSSVRPYREADPEIGECKLCAGEIDSPGNADYSLFEYASEADPDEVLGP